MTNPAAPQDVYEALYQLQAERIVLAKDQQGQVGQQKTKYADLVQANDVILPRLFALGLLWLTSPTLRMIPGPNGQEDPRFVLDWTLRHIPSGTSIDGTYPLMDAGTAMKAGSAITYARRYALVAITNAVAQDEDDDGRGTGRPRPGFAQRSDAPPRPVQDRPATAQRGQRPQAEKARPAQQPPPPPNTGGPQGPPPSSAPAEPHRGRGGLITKPMTTKLAICVKETGLVGDDRLPFVVGMIGREIDSTWDLTFDEGRALIDAFEKAKQAGGSPDEKQAAAMTIYLRTTGTDNPAAGALGTDTVTPTVRDRTRAAVTGDPNGAGHDDEPPWDEPVQDALMPDPYVPIGDR